jgi:hypothetical protein
VRTLWPPIEERGRCIDAPVAAAACPNRHGPENRAGPHDEIGVAAPTIGSAHSPLAIHPSVMTMAA